MNPPSTKVTVPVAPDVPPVIVSLAANCVPLNALTVMVPVIAAWFPQT